MRDPTVNGFVKDLGYPFEKHVYTTKDGYINNIIRIKGYADKGFLGGGEETSKPVVIYQHGLLDSCAGIIADGEDSLGLKLVKAGYDLWLPNSRGNRYSKDHEKSEG